LRSREHKNRSQKTKHPEKTTRSHLINGLALSKWLLFQGLRRPQNICEISSTQTERIENTSRENKQKKQTEKTNRKNKQRKQTNQRKHQGNASRKYIKKTHQENTASSLVLPKT
jgi:hypothetical protein